MFYINICLKIEDCEGGMGSSYIRVNAVFVSFYWTVQVKAEPPELFRLKPLRLPIKQNFYRIRWYGKH